MRPCFQGRRAAALQLFPRRSCFSPRREGEAFACKGAALGRAIGFPSRGSCRRKPTDEVESCLRHNITAVPRTSPYCFAAALQQCSTPHLIRHCFAMPPSPRGEAVGASRLMRWQLLVAITPRLCCVLCLTALPQGCSSTPRPTSSVIDVAMPPSPQGEVFCRRHPLFPPHPARTSLFSYLFSCFLKKLQVSH